MNDILAKIKILTEYGYDICEICNLDPEQKLSELNIEELTEMYEKCLEVVREKNKRNNLLILISNIALMNPGKIDLKGIETKSLKELEGYLINNMFSE